MTDYVYRLEALAAPDIFFLGHGPEAQAASHLAYIKPNSGCHSIDVAGLIRSPRASSNITSPSSKQGEAQSPEDEDECRRATIFLPLVRPRLSVRNA